MKYYSRLKLEIKRYLRVNFALPPTVYLVQDYCTISLKWLFLPDSPSGKRALGEKASEGYYGRDMTDITCDIRS